MPMIGRVEV